MSKPVLNATFQPQQWVNDHAVDDGASFDFDAGPALLSLSADRVRFIVGEVERHWGRDLDMLAEAADLIGNGEDQHSGPFYVDVDADDLVGFLKEVGIADVSKLTDDELARIRDGYSVQPSVPAIG